jgi:hypothetical protein
MEKKYYLLGLLLIVAIVGWTYTSYERQTNSEVTPRNYKAEVLLGITPPNMQSRIATVNDIDTGLNLRSSSGDLYRLFESRDSKDFVNIGKTFVVKQ